MKQWLLVVAAAGLVACGDAGIPVESSELVGSDESVESSVLQLPEQARLRAGSPVSLRTEPSREASVLLVVPVEAEVTLLRSGSEQGFYQVTFQGHEGWAYGAYLRPAEAAEFAQSTSALTLAETDAVMSRASSAIGYSYWWGHAVWGCGIGPGSCSSTGTHSGNGGLDSAGYVNKSWHVPPSANASTCVDGYTYSLTQLYNNRYHWTQVSRSELRKGDVLITQGHALIYISGDGLGTMDVYECRGCTSGCLRRLRTATSDYIAIRRHTGWL